MNGLFVGLALHGGRPRGRPLSYTTDWRLLMKSSRLAGMFNEIDEKIDEHGWFAIGVFPTERDEEKLSWTYSVGFTKTWDAPEVIILGLSARDAHGLLYSVATELAEGRKIETNVPFSRIVLGFDVIFTDVPRLEQGNWFGAGRAYYKARKLGSFDAVQMVWPDADGTFPWQPGYDETFSEQQPVISPPTSN